jgi:hypothetical protein
MDHLIAIDRWSKKSTLQDTKKMTIALLAND